MSDNHAVNSEIEYLRLLERRLQSIFDVSVAARDEAQIAVNSINSLKQKLLQRQIELQRKELANHA